MAGRRILFICGSMNQTTQMHAISRHLAEYEQAFTPFYCDGALEALRRLKGLEFTIIGDKLARRCRQYLEEQHLPIDHRGRRDAYDLVVTCSDVFVQDNIRDRRIVLVQEGITDPEDRSFRLVQRHRWLPRWIAGTAATGLSDAYRAFCVASDGYRDFFVRKGAKAGEDRGDRHPELRPLRALPRQRLSPPPLRARVHVAAAGDLPRRGPEVLHPGRSPDRQRAPDDLQVPPQRRPRRAPRTRSSGTPREP